jgi:hypothetical protein
LKNNIKRGDAVTPFLEQQKISKNAVSFVNMCKNYHAANFAKISGMGIVALFVLNMQIR